jgi:hypothetical protein
VVSASASNAHRAQLYISHLIDVANINLRKPQNRERKGELPACYRGKVRETVGRSLH